MSRWFRLVVTLMVLVLGTGTAGAAYAASAQIEQVRNGTATATTTPIPSWATGNAGASNSHYLESHSIAYRTVMDGLPTDGSVVELVIGYDVKRSGSYALDYLTHYQRLLPHVLFGHRDPEVFDPLNGVTGVAAGTSTAPIPTPTDRAFMLVEGWSAAGSDSAPSGSTERFEPELAALYRPAPNPFTGDMRMAYAVGATGERVRISVYDLAGRLVRNLTDDVQSAGQHTVVWDGRDAHGSRMRQGVYFVHAQIGAQARQVRVTFVK